MLEILNKNLCVFYNTPSKALLFIIFVSKHFCEWAEEMMIAVNETAAMFIITF